MRARLLTALAAGVLAAFAAAGCGADSDSSNGGDAGTTPRNTSPAATVPTAGSDDTATSPSGALGGAGPNGGDSGTTSPSSGGTSPGY